MSELDDLSASDLTSLSDQDMTDFLTRAEEVRSKFEALDMRACVEAKKRRLARRRGVRSETNLIAGRTRQSVRAVGSRFRTAEDLVEHMSLVHRALEMGVITLEHARLLRRYYGQKPLRAALQRDQSMLIGWAQESWATFDQNLAMWAIVNDPTDPQDLDEQAFDDRSLVTSEAFNSVLVEMQMPAIMWEQVLVIVRPRYQRMLDADWAEARARVGEDAGPSDLLRTDRQRMLDAFMEMARASEGRDDPGATIVVNLITDLDTVTAEAERQAQAARTKERDAARARDPQSTDPWSEALEDDEHQASAAPTESTAPAESTAPTESTAPATTASAGSAATCWAEVASERAEQALTAVGVPPSVGWADLDPNDPRAIEAKLLLGVEGRRAIDSRYVSSAPPPEWETDWRVAARKRSKQAKLRRCETESGLSITPATALLGALAGGIRRFTLGLTDLDFTASKQSRLFRGAMRQGILLRDRSCQGEGCDAHASKCQADHIQPHSSGGATEPVNGQALCPACHRWKTYLDALGIVR